jgi:nucleotide-binding universal stress UspA family protein
MAEESERPVESGELNPGGGEYAAQQPRGVAGTGGQIGPTQREPEVTILVPLDGSALSAAALPIAAWLARRMRARVTLLRVMSDLREPGSMAATAEQILTQAAAQFAGLAVQRQTEDALDPADGILAAVRREHADLVVMATHSRSGLAELAHGSVAERVIRSGTVPVTLVHPIAAR